MNPWIISAICITVLILLGLNFIISLIKIIKAFIKKNCGKKVVIRFISGILLLSIGLIFICSHSTYVKYNDWFIKRQNINKIEEKYGSFDIGKYESGQSGTVGYYIYTDDGPVMPDHLKHYYYMEYDKNGIISKVYDGCQAGG